MHACMYVGAYVCMYVYACVSVCLYVCIHVCMNNILAPNPGTQLEPNRKLNPAITSWISTGTQGKLGNIIT